MSDKKAAAATKDTAPDKKAADADADITIADANKKAGDASLSPTVLPKSVVVHPLVLLSVVDHYNRIAKDTKKRVVGILLGESHKGKVDVTNSYAVPFDEDLKDPSIWYLDHTYHENLHYMFKKVNAKEKVVGWYSTGPKIRPADLEINELMRRYVPNPILTIIDVNPKDDLEIPVESYCAVATPEEQGKQAFMHLASEIGAYEAEEVGVEHLLRDIRDTTTGTIADQVNGKLASLKGLKKRMEEMHRYLTNVLEGKLPVNHQILYNMQDIFNLSPNLQVESLVKAFAVKTNDNMLVIYLSSLIRSIISLHNLINNKAMNRDAEAKEKADKQAADAKKAEKNKEKEKLEEDKKKNGDKPESDSSTSDKEKENKSKDNNSGDKSSSAPMDVEKPESKSSANNEKDSNKDAEASKRVTRSTAKSSAPAAAPDTTAKKAPPKKK